MFGLHVAVWCEVKVMTSQLTVRIQAVKERKTNNS